MGVSEVQEDALRPLVSAEASGDHCGQGQGLLGGPGRGLRQEVVGVGGDRFGFWRTSLCLRVQ